MGLLDLTGFLSPVIQRLVDLIPDPVAREKAQAEATAQLLTIAAAQDASQSKVNEIEAASTSLFVAGWRPMIGWICAGGLSYAFVFGPMLGGLAALYAPTVTLPTLPADVLMNLLFAMLGLGGMRTYEKTKGVATGEH